MISKYEYYVKDYQDIWRFMHRVKDIIEDNTDLVVSRQYEDDSELYGRRKDGIDLSKYVVSGKLMLVHKEIPPLHREYLRLHEKRNWFGGNQRDLSYVAMEYEGYVIIRLSDGRGAVPHHIYDDNNKLVKAVESSKGLVAVIESYFKELAYRG